jgi:glycosyltransferase involved in cell wall biosynthesis
VRVLISAYACEPDAGSEPGAGWAWARAAAEHHEVCVITRANNRIAIEGATRDVPASLRFSYVELPVWARFWKRGSRGIRLYYVFWQLAARREARRLHAQMRFDLVHHVTFANVWLPALAALRDVPFVLGPVGGGVRVPRRLVSCLGTRGRMREVLLGVQRRFASFSPLVRAGIRHAAVILTQNAETAAALPSTVRSDVRIRPNALVAGVTETSTVEGSTILYAGRLVAWKGVRLAIDALVDLEGWSLTVVGEGPDRSRLARRAEALGVRDRIEFVGPVDRTELQARLGSYAVLVQPSLREECSWIVAEARAASIPVVAFDRGGPAAQAGEGDPGLVLVSTGRSETEAARNLAGGILEAVRRPRTPSRRFLADGLVAFLDALYADVTADAGVAHSIVLGATA